MTEVYRNKPFISAFIFIRAAALPLSLFQGSMLTIFLGKPLVNVVLIVLGLLIFYFNDELIIAKQNSIYFKRFIYIYSISILLSAIIGWYELYILFGGLLILDYIWALYSYKCYKQLYRESNEIK